MKHQQHEKGAVNHPSLKGPALISPKRGGVYLRLGLEYWNGGIMEYWESKADVGLIL
ncbi:hypothetical protein D1AOALGA4SA_6166 [Olavius algarvensis Delta 1 endosymbiont]|nr:hypothetical protein D1AOALGA4SA_6166 [Olavius algarvensis Delta 1 endosymbiont]